MGSSMSDPAHFKQKNREKQFQAYQRKYPDGDIIPVKMRLKHVKSEGNIFNKQTIECKNQLKKELKNFQSDMNFNRNENQKLQNQQEQNKQVSKQKIRVSFTLNPVQNQQKLKQFQQRQSKNLNQRSQKISCSNLGSNKSNLKKITLNNRTYEVDIEKMKCRRQKNKQRYTNSILSSLRTQTVATTQNHSQKQMNGNSFVQPISSLGMQSQLNSLKAKKFQQDSYEKQTDSLYDSDKLKDSSNFSDQKNKQQKKSRTTYKEQNQQPTTSFYSERKL